MGLSARSAFKQRQSHSSYIARNATVPARVEALECRIVTVPLCPVTNPTLFRMPARCVSHAAMVAVLLVVAVAAVKVGIRRQTHFPQVL